jgi:hypothetical protein
MNYPAALRRGTDPKAIRVSHKINGRIPSALNKKVNELENWEKTQYWERMMFVIEVPSISDIIYGNEISLTIGGVRALNHESLFSKKSIEKFKVFIGFNNKVCTNLLVSTDGIILEMRVSGLEELFIIVSTARILFVNQYGRVKRLNCPFRVIALDDIPPDIITGDFYRVDFVKMTLDLKEVFIINGKEYYIRYFQII